MPESVCAFLPPKAKTIAKAVVKVCFMFYLPRLNQTDQGINCTFKLFSPYVYILEIYVLSWNQANNTCCKDNALSVRDHVQVQL